MTLNQMTPGNSAIIHSIGGEGVLRRRLLDMGLTPGTQVKVRKVAPMGDPMELFLRGYVLTLRNEDAVKITLEPKTQLGHSCGGCTQCGAHKKNKEERQ